MNKNNCKHNDTCYPHQKKNNGLHKPFLFLKGEKKGKIRVKKEKALPFLVVPKYKSVSIDK